MSKYNKHTWRNGELITADRMNAIENQLETTTPGATIIANDYNSSTTYNIGEYCLYNGNLWRCISQSTGNAPEEGMYWTNTTLVEELNNGVDASIASDYSTTKTYHINDYVIYDNKLYRNIYNGTTSGSWNSDRWEETILTNDVTDALDALDGLGSAALDTAYEALAAATSAIDEVEALTSDIADAIASIPSNYDDLLATLATDFSAGTYTAGQYVWYNGTLYKFTSDHSGSWTGTDIQSVVIGDELTGLKSATTSMLPLTITWDANGNGYYIAADGTLTASANFHYSNLISVIQTPGTASFVYSGSSSSVRVHGYDSNGSWVKQVAYAQSITSDVSFSFDIDDPSISYIRISCPKTATPTIRQMRFVYENEIIQTSIATGKLTTDVNGLDEAVYKNKTTTATGTLSVQSGGTIASSTHLVDITIPNGTTYTFRVNATGISKYYLYENNTGSAVANNCNPNQDYTVTASHDVTWLSIYATDLTATETIEGVASFTVTRANSLQARMDTAESNIGTAQSEITALQGQVAGILPIGLDDTSFYSVGKNLFDGVWETGKYVNWSNGQIQTNSDYKLTGKIPIEPNTDYVISGSNSVNGLMYAIYNSSDAYVTGVANTKQFTSPATAAYIRFSCLNAITNVQIEKGTTATAYEPYRMFVDPDYIWSHEMQADVAGMASDAANSAIEDDYLDYTMADRYNPADAVTDKYVNPSTGNISSTTGYYTTDYMEIRPGETLYFIRRDNLTARQAGFYAGYDANKTFVSGSGGSDATSVTQSGKVRYIRASFAYQSAYYDRRPEGIFVVATNKPTYAPATITGPVFTNEKRSDVYIYGTDTEDQVIEKLVNAYKTGNCDVRFERAHYTFGTYLPTVKATYALNENEIPVGNNCHYYFNGAILEATIDLETLGSSFYCNLFGCERFPSSFEMYDGILIATDTRYVMHDEASGYSATYRHLYRNMVMQYITDASTDVYRKCIGGGTGKNGVIDIDGCKFVTDGQEPDVSYHGNATDVEGAEFNVNVRNCWFSKTFAANELSANQTARLFFTGNSTASAVVLYARWSITSFLNEIRS